MRGPDSFYCDGQSILYIKSDKSMPIRTSLVDYKFTAKHIQRNLLISSCYNIILLYSSLDFQFVFWAFPVKYFSPAESKDCVFISD